MGPNRTHSWWAKQGLDFRGSPREATAVMEEPQGQLGDGSKAGGMGPAGTEEPAPRPVEVAATPSAPAISQQKPEIQPRM